MMAIGPVEAPRSQAAFLETLAGTARAQVIATQLLE
jgi:hypothetical protein